MSRLVLCVKAISPPGDEMLYRPVSLSHQEINVPTLRTSRKISGLVPLGIFKVPGLNCLTVETVNHDLEVLVWPNKHVVGAVEYDGVLVRDHVLIQQSAAVSGIVEDDKARVLWPCLTHCRPEDTCVAQQRHLARILEGIGKGRKTHFHILVM